MSGELDVMRSLSVRWKVRVPTQYKAPAVSTDFRFRQALWCLACREVNSVIRLGLFHLSGLPVERQSLSYAARVEGDKTRHVLSKMSERSFQALSETSELPKSCEFVWGAMTDNVHQADSSFGCTRWLTFQVTFKERELNSLQTGEASRRAADEAVQTTLCASPLDKDLQSFSSASMQTSWRKNPTPCLESLSKDLEKLLDADSDPDVELHCEGHTTKAHKIVLCARSPVLESMLKGDMVEGRTGVANIKDMDVDTFRRFLRYLYTGKLDTLTVESAIRLYEAGDMYEVASLAGRCSRFLVDNLTVENSCDVLAVADAHSDADTTEEVIRFIVEKKVPLSDDPWTTFCESHPRLANKVFGRFCKMICK